MCVRVGNSNVVFTFFVLLLQIRIKFDLKNKLKEQNRYQGYCSNYNSLIYGHWGHTCVGCGGTGLGGSHGRGGGDQEEEPGVSVAGWLAIKSTLKSGFLSTKKDKNKLDYFLLDSYDG